MPLRFRNRLGARSAIVLHLAVLLCVSLAGAQGPPPATPGPTPPQNPPPASVQAAAQPAAPLTPAQQRSAQLATDTAQLQQLAAELKAAMNKSTKDTLSFVVIKKAQEVEKLARKVHDEMRASLLAGS